MMNYVVDNLDMALTGNRSTLDLPLLRSVFGKRLQENVKLDKYTSARIGGCAAGFLVAHSVEEMVEIVSSLWEHNQPFRILGGGSNMLVSDNGVRSVVVLNCANSVRFDLTSQTPHVWAESGANLGLVARQAVNKGLEGLEWAVGIPGTIGGAILGNAGAHGGDIAKILIVAEILHRHIEGTSEYATLPAKYSQETWTNANFEFAYRKSALKGMPGSVVILSGTLQVKHSTRDYIQAKAGEYSNYRRNTQPQGASLGSMFINPPGDSAGRLIEAAGLKGYRIGGAEISPKHANFFINHGKATASDVHRLIQLARLRVKEHFNIDLELEIELVGDWDLED